MPKLFPSESEGLPQNEEWDLSSEPEASKKIEQRENHYQYFSEYRFDQPNGRFYDTEEEQESRQQAAQLILDSFQQPKISSEQYKQLLGIARVLEVLSRGEICDFVEKLMVTKLPKIPASGREYFYEKTICFHFERWIDKLQKPFLADVPLSQLTIDKLSTIDFDEMTGDVALARKIFDFMRINNLSPGYNNNSYAGLRQQRLEEFVKHYQQSIESASNPNEEPGERSISQDKES